MKMGFNASIVLPLHCQCHTALAMQQKDRLFCMLHLIQFPRPRVLLLHQPNVDDAPSLQLIAYCLDAIVTGILPTSSTFT